MPTDFLSIYLQHNAIYESPGSFWRWSAYATIAATLRDNCYRRQGDSRLYTNIYVMFLAESGGRKGKPIDFSESLLSKIQGARAISGRASIQAILDEIARGETDKKTGALQKGGAAIFYAQELSAGIVADPEAVNILTDIYDYKSNPFKSRLRTGPCFNIEQIIFSMLTGSNEEMLKGIFDEKGKKGGLLARTFLIVPNESRPPNSLMRIDQDAIARSKLKVIDALKEIAKLNGEFLFSDGCIDEFESWYKPFYLRYQNKKEATGAMARIHTGIQKLSLILAANDLTLEVTKHHMEQAINECIGLLPNYRAFVIGGNASDESKAGAIVLPLLHRSPGHTVSHKQIIRDHWQDFTVETLDKLMVMLKQGGIVQDGMILDGIPYYTLTKVGIDMMEGKE